MYRYRYTHNFMYRYRYTHMYRYRYIHLPTTILSWPPVANSLPHIENFMTQTAPYIGKQSMRKRRGRTTTEGYKKVEHSNG